MNRCTADHQTRISVFDRFVNFHRHALFLIAISLFFTWVNGLFSTQVQAQTVQREFPAAALRGKMLVTAPPNISLDGQPDQLSPSARIRAENNMLALSGSLVGQTLAVNYTRDAAGLVNEVWVLNAQEARQKRASQARANTGFFSFIPPMTNDQTGPSPIGSKLPGTRLPDPSLQQPMGQTK